MIAVESSNLAAIEMLIANGANLDIDTVSIILLFSILVAVNTYKISLTSFSLFHLSISRE